MIEHAVLQLWVGEVYDPIPPCRRDRSGIQTKEVQTAEFRTREFSLFLNRAYGI